MWHSSYQYPNMSVDTLWHICGVTAKGEFLRKSAGNGRGLHVSHGGGQRDGACHVSRIATYVGCMVDSNATNEATDWVLILTSMGLEMVISPPWLAHFSYNMKHVLSMRSLANSNRGRIHFLSIFLELIWILRSFPKWRIMFIEWSYRSLPPIMLTIELRMVIVFNGY